ncbi:hypothetical protein AUP68_00587 [Ilyonectria robusta]
MVFYPILTILALALHDHAFDAPSLTSAHRVLETKAWGPMQCIPPRRRTRPCPRPDDAPRSQLATFHHAYLNEIANFDLQNAFLEEEKQNQLFLIFAHFSLTRDPRAMLHQKGRVH